MTKAEFVFMIYTQWHHKCIPGTIDLEQPGVKGAMEMTHSSLLTGCPEPLNHTIRPFKIVK